MKNRSAKYRALGFLLFFVISTFANISRADEHLYSQIDYFHYSSTNDVELVVAAGHNDLTVWRNDSRNANDQTPIFVQPPLFNPFVIVFYESCVIQKLKTLGLNKSFHLDLITVLQKKNTWHQSKEEPTPLS